MWTDDELSRRLVDAAGAVSPPFSPSLHGRVMRAVRGAAIAPPPRRTSWAVRAAVAGVAAAAAVTVARWPNAPVRKPHRVVSVPTVSPWSAVAAAEPVARRWSAARYGYLDRDADRAARFLIAQLDPLPTVGDRSSPTSKPAARSGA